MKILRKTDIESMEKELQVLRNPEKYLGGVKGDSNNPYTQAEFDSFTGNWAGGYVEGWGYVGPEATVTGSRSYTRYYNGFSIETIYIDNDDLAIMYMSQSQDPYSDSGYLGGGAVGASAAMAGGGFGTLAGALVGGYFWLEGSQWNSYLQGYISNSNRNGITIERITNTGGSFPGATTQIYVTFNP